MAQNLFFSQNNLELLWNIIAEEYQLINEDNSEKTTTSTTICIKGIRDIFNTNCNALKESTILKHEIMTINKMFLTQMNTAIQRLFPNIRNDMKKNKIKIIQNDSQENHPAILHQEIQSEKRNKFNNQLEQHQKDLNSMLATNHPPPSIDMSDNIGNQEDKNPQTIQDEYNKTLAERNYDPVPSSSQKKINFLKTKDQETKSISWSDNQIINTNLDQNSLLELEDITPKQPISLKQNQNTKTNNQNAETNNQNIIIMLQTLLTDIADVKDKVNKITYKLTKIQNNISI